jgi:hypothetical protein
MSHGPEHHIEHAEHAGHAAHDPFERRVTVSVAVVAAILAAISVLAHRAHTDTLLYQGEAIQWQTRAGIEHSRAVDQWAFYQSNKLRGHLYQINIEMLDEMNGASSHSKTLARWQNQRDKYESRLAEEKRKAEDLEANVAVNQQRAKEMLERSAAAHHRADRLDYGEMLVELAVVLCSLAVLTRRKSYWTAGLASCGLGTLVALSGLLGWFMTHSH